nr:MAG TPA: Lsm interaction motif [Caudoviricetes sp.]
MCNLSVLVDLPLSNEDFKFGSKVENNNHRW